MILTNYYSRPFNAKKPGVLGALGSAATAFGIGYASSLSKEEKAANRERLRSLLGLQPQTQKPAQVTDAVAKPVVSEAVVAPVVEPDASQESAASNYESGWSDSGDSEQEDAGLPVDLNNADPELASSSKLD